MDARAMKAPKLLLYHDITSHGTIPAEEAARRFDEQLARISSAGLNFRTMQEYLDGRLGHRDVVVTFDDALRSFHDVAWPVLRRHGIAPTLFVVSQFAGRSDARGVLMGWDEVRAVAEQGVTVGGHAATHVPLDEIAPERMRREIAQSTRSFAEQGLPVSTFAYPFGRFNAETKAVVEAAGYKAAFTVMNGGADRFEIRRRLLTGGESPAWLRLVLSDRFFEVRNAARLMVPARLLKQDQPIARSRWGAQALGLAEVEPRSGDAHEREVALEPTNNDS